MAKASEIVKQAQAWIGKKESDGSFKVIIDKYNSHKPLARSYKVKYTDEWCAPFVTAVAIMCNATDIIPKECGCQRQIELWKKLGRWQENDAYVPNPGDYIYYDWQDNGKGDNQGWSDHVGIVEKVENGKITIIEGNINSSVDRRTLEVNGRYIRGYGLPKYEKEATVEAKPSTPSATPSTTGLKAGQAVKLSDTPVYRNATTATVSSRKTGTFYLWSAEVVGNRVRITNRADRVGKAGQVTGWMNVADITGTVAYYPKYTGTSYQIDIVFSVIGVPAEYRGGYKKREPIANANGITNYKGLGTQNLALVALAKKGILKKA